MIKNSININKTQESLNSDGQQFYQYQQTKESFNSDCQQFHQYQQNKRKFIKQRLSTIPPISTKQKKIYQTVMVNNSSNINKPKESVNSDGQQFYQYQQTKRKF